MKNNQHTTIHDLVRVQPEVIESEPTLEDRLLSMENEFSNHKDEMGGQMSQLDAKVDGLHTLLAAVLEKLSELNKASQNRPSVRIEAE